MIIKPIINEGKNIDQCKITCWNRVTTGGPTKHTGDSFQRLQAAQQLNLVTRMQTKFKRDFEIDEEERLQVSERAKRASLDENEHTGDGFPEIAADGHIHY